MDINLAYLPAILSILVPVVFFLVLVFRGTGSPREIAWRDYKYARSLWYRRNADLEKMSELGMVTDEDMEVVVRAKDGMEAALEKFRRTGK